MWTSLQIGTARAMRRAASVVNKGRLLAATLAVAGMAALSSRAALAQGFTLPDTGVDVASGVTAMITKLGLVAVAAVGGCPAFIVIVKAIKWARKVS